MGGQTNAEDITVNSWQQIKNNAQNYGNTYIVDSNASLSPNEQISIGNWTDSPSLAWNLNGNNVKIDSNWKESGIFSIGSNINSAVFENIRALHNKNGYGGVIYNSASNLNISNSWFERNGTKNGSDRKGGVIYNNGNIENISGVTFLNNFTNGGQGGAIFNESRKTIDKIIDTTFEKNENYDGGSGAAIANEGTITLIKDSEFKNNKVHNGSYGGAIFNKSGGNITTIDNVKFTENIAGSGDWGTGGAIYNSGTIGNIANSEFEENIAYGDGYNGSGAAIANEGTITLIKDSEFKNNKVHNGSYGGAIFNKSGGNITTIDNVKFTENIAGSGDWGTGGAIYNSGTIGNIANSEFEKNIAYGDGYNGGGAIYNEYSIGSIVNTKFKSNGTWWNEKNGGAIFNKSGATITLINNSEFTGNGVKFEGAQNWTSVGGAIYNAGTLGDMADKDNTGILGNTKFSKNQAGYGGAAIFNDNTGQIAKITAIFEENYSKRNGGAAINNKGYIYSVDGSTFTANTADTSSDSNVMDARGAAIVNKEGGHIEEIKDSYFYSNSTIDFGGAINNEGANTKIDLIDNVTFGDENKGNHGASAGAINNYDSAKIGKITNSIFQYNDAKETTDCAQGNGGAIRNYQNASIDSIVGTLFEGNTAGGLLDQYRANRNAYVKGGAIYNDDNSTITVISNTTFTNNHSIAGDDETSNYVGHAYGGAIFNENGSTIGNLTENTKFEKNTATGTEATGGAIFNAGRFGTIDGTFKENKAESVSQAALGGAIANTGTNAIMGNITADFTKNSISSSEDIALGGAIYNNNSAQIGDITGNFEGNNVTSGYNYDSSATEKEGASGGAIYNNNSAKIGKIAGDFIGNYAQSTNSEAGGGAISNSNVGIIGDIVTTSGFSQNYAKGGDGAIGGAIQNRASSEIGKIQADFKENYAESANGYAYGGAIANLGTIGDITGSFEDNHTSAAEYSMGGGLWSSTDITVINGSFKNNYAETSSSSQLALGGAIYSNRADIKLNIDGIDSVASGNYTKDNRGQISNFIFTRTNRWNGSNETFVSPTITISTVNGGTFEINDKIDGGEVNADWTDVKRKHAYNLALTGDADTAIYLNDEVLNANSTLTNTNLYIGVNNGNESTIFAHENDTLNAQSGSISLIDDSISDYQVNKLVSTDTQWKIDVDWNSLEGDTITVSDQSSNGEVKLYDLNIINMLGQYVDSAIIQIIKGADGDESNSPLQLNIDNLDTTSLSVEPYLPNVYSNSQIGKISDEVTLQTTDTLNDSIGLKGIKLNTLEYISSLVTVDGEAKTFTFTEDAPTYVYDGNLNNIEIIGDLTIQGSSTSNVIDLANIAELTIKDDASLTVDSASIANSKGIENDGSLTIKNAKLSDDITNNGEIVFAGSGNEITSKISGNNGTLNYKEGTQNILNNISNQSIEVNGANTYADKLSYISDSSNSITLNSGSFNIAGLGLNTLALNALNMNGGTLNIDSTDVDLKNKTMGHISAPNSQTATGGTINLKALNVISEAKDNKTTINFIDAPVASTVKTNVKEVVTPIYKYDVEYNNSNGNFTFTRGVGNALNPSIMAAPVATQLGAYSAMNNSLDYVFEHSDVFSLLPHNARIAMLNQNKYAINDSHQMTYASNEFTNNNAVWAKPYAMFESVALRGAARTHVNSYGTIVGGDGLLKEMKHGWARVGTAYAGYNGSHISFDGVSTYQNGGLIGMTETWYKNNFWTALTISAGASVGEAHTMYGKEDMTSLMAGIANKTGYNWEFKDGKYIIQPTLLTSYTFVNTFDYNNAAGVRIDSDPLHVIQIHPHLKFIMNTENGWQPYFRVGVVANIMDDTKFKANDVRLPETSIKPYAEYGLGVQKRWSERFTAWCQAMVRSGGRNGIALTAGFRWALGSDKPKVKNEKVQKPTTEVKVSDKKVIKRLPQQP